MNKILSVREIQWYFTNGHQKMSEICFIWQLIISAILSIIIILIIIYYYIIFINGEI